LAAFSVGAIKQVKIKGFSALLKCLNMCSKSSSVYSMFLHEEKRPYHTMLCIYSKFQAQTTSVAVLIRWTMPEKSLLSSL
jgi:hypothetical protein